MLPLCNNYIWSNVSESINIFVIENLFAIENYDVYAIENENLFAIENKK